jgi:protein SCO1/2
MMTVRASVAARLLIAPALLLVSCAGDDEEMPQPDNPAGVVVHGVDESRFHGAELPTPYSMPDITLTATDDEPFNLITDTGHEVTLVFYGYTHCPDVCQLVMSDLTAAMNQLADDVRERTQMVFITTDPARDDTSVLREYLDRFDPDYVGLTGELDDITTAAKAMGVPIQGMRKLPSGGYEVGHGAQVVGFRGDTAPVIWTKGTPVDDLAADITALASPQPE